MNFKKIPYNKHKRLKNFILLQSCIVGLEVRVWADKQEVPGSNPTLVQYLVLLPKLYFFSIFFKNENLPKKCIFFKHILALPTWGLKCFVLTGELFLSGKFDLGHPVVKRIFSKMFIYKTRNIFWLQFWWKFGKNCSPSLLINREKLEGYLFL